MCIHELMELCNCFESYVYSHYTNLKTTAKVLDGAICGNTAVVTVQLLQLFISLRQYPVALWIHHFLWEVVLIITGIPL